MYIWVVLATFIAIIASYNLPLRADARSLVVEPLAGAHITKVASKHIAALNYLVLNSPPNTPASYVPYTPKQLLADASLKKYLPYGYKLDSSYTSRVYCLTKDGKTALSDCKRESSDVLKIVVTYGYIPHKWMNVSTGKPSSDYMSAMHSSTDLGNILGYVDVNDVNKTLFGGADLQIKGKLNVLMAIPNVIGKDAYFGKMCNRSITGNKVPYCLAYMSQF